MRTNNWCSIMGCESIHIPKCSVILGEHTVSKSREGATICVLDGVHARVGLRNKPELCRGQEVAELPLLITLGRIACSIPSERRTNALIRSTYHLRQNLEGELRKVDSGRKISHVPFVRSITVPVLTF